MIMSGKMLLQWLAVRHDQPRAAAAAAMIEGAVERVLADRNRLTRDLGGSASTAEMGDAVAAAV